MVWHSTFNLPYRFLQYVKCRLQSIAPFHIQQLPMAIMLDETQAYKSEQQPIHKHKSHTTMLQQMQSICNTVHTVPQTTNHNPSTKPVCTMHKALRGTAAQICNELDTLAAQETSHKKHLQVNKALD